MCVACRKLKQRQELIRLTRDFQNRNVMLNKSAAQGGSDSLQGRSAYICKAAACVDLALKTTKLKHALEGRKKPGIENQKRVSWPLEAQLIESMYGQCPDQSKNMPKY